MYEKVNILGEGIQSYDCFKTWFSVEDNFIIGGLDRVKCDLDLPLADLKQDFIKNIKLKIGSVEEVWHRDYVEIDSGNVIDEEGLISDVLEHLRESLKWQKEEITFDKIMLREDDTLNFDEFHADHFCSIPPRIRTAGFMERAIFNLNDEVRYFSVLNIDPELVNSAIKDPMCLADYEHLLEVVQPIDITILEIPPMESVSMIHGIIFNAFTTVHSGVGKRGDLAAVISKWHPFLIEGTSINPPPPSSV
jgi:hypothetical protein